MEVLLRTVHPTVLYNHPGKLNTTRTIRTVYSLMLKVDLICDFVKMPYAAMLSLA
jgi:hypothetical protein